MTTTETIPLHVQQAAGLRALADAIEQHPELGESLGFALHTVWAPLKAATVDARGELLTFHRLMSASGADVRIENGDDYCQVHAVFGPIRTKLYASAHAMIGAPTPAPLPRYAPLLATVDAEVQR